jgi:acyl-CoA synthetase (AMP-forming)/AMP-acid ligase II
VGKFKLPRRIMILPELPLTPYGKVLKAELRERFLRESAAEAAASGD